MTTDVHPRLPYKWLALIVGGVYIGGATIERAAWPLLLPTIRDDFDIATSEVVWLIVMFALGMAGSTLTVGHLGDKLGHKRLALIGFMAEGLLLVVASVTPWFWLLLLLRLFQGVAAATALNNIQALTMGAWPADQRGRALGFISALPPLGLITGLLFAGFVSDAIGWRWVIFATGLHITSEALLVRLFLVEDAFPTEPARVILRRLDWAGAFGFLASIVTLILAARFVTSDSLRPLAAVLFPCAIAGFVIVIWLERRSTNPVLNLQLFTRRTFAVAVGGMVLFSLIFGANNFLFPFYLQKGVGWSVAYSGSVLIALNAVQPVGSPISGFMSDKLGPRPLQFTGIAVLLAGLLLASQLGEAPTTLRIIPALLLMSLGQTLFGPANNRTIYNGVPGDALGTASAISASGRYVGQSIGAALAAALLATSSDAQIADAFQTSMLLLAAVLALGMLLIQGGHLLPKLARRPRASSLLNR